jgi:hypothetical protein
MSMQSAPSLMAERPLKTHSFEVDIGQESITLPPGFAHATRAWLLSLRDRPMFMSRVTPAVFAEMGRSYKVDRGDMPVHLKGMPLYFCVEDREMKFWPVPAHKWQGVIEA